MHVPKDDQDSRSTGERIWENDLAWKREDLKEMSLVRMPSHGIWQITEEGERNVESWAQRIKTMTESRPDWVADFKVHSDGEFEYGDGYQNEYYITEATIHWALRIATNQ